MCVCSSRFIWEFNLECFILSVFCSCLRCPPGRPHVSVCSSGSDHSLLWAHGACADFTVAAGAGTKRCDFFLLHLKRHLCKSSESCCTQPFLTLHVFQGHILCENVAFGACQYNQALFTTAPLPVLHEQEIAFTPLLYKGPVLTAFALQHCVDDVDKYKHSEELHPD